MTSVHAASSAVTASRVRWANVFLWVAQALLAVIFASSGAVKVFATDWFRTIDAWPADVPRSLLVLIGVAELAGALGLLLPRLTGVQPRLTMFAALGLLVIMVLATGFHASRGELDALPINAAIGGLAAFVACGRWRLAP